MQCERVPAAAGRPISYLRGGEGPAVVLLHGVPGSAHTWDDVLARLTGVHAVVPDLLGFGASASAEDLHAEAQAAAVGALLDGIGIATATFVTHDFGGPVALRLVEQRPDLAAGLLLSATNAFGDTPVPFPLSSIFWPLLGPVAARLLFSPASLRMMLRTGVGSPRRAPDAATAVGDARQAASIRSIFETSLRHLPELYGPLAEVLAHIRVPTEVVWGDRDPFFGVDTARRTADAIPGARLTILDGAGHFLPHERPDELAAAVDRLIASTDQRRDRPRPDR